MKKIIYYFLTLTLLLGGLALTSFAAVDGKYTLLEPLPCVPTATQTCDGSAPVKEIAINEYIEYVFKFAIAIAVFLAVVVIIFGGFEYMLSESFTKKDSAKTRITNAVLGLLAALLSYLILATIDPRLVSIKTQIEPIRSNFVDKKGLKDFNTSLESELRTLTNEERKSVSESDERLKKLKNQRDDLISIYNNQEQFDTYIEEDEYIKELQNLSLQIRAEEASQIKTISSGVGREEMRTATSILSDPDQYSTSLLRGVTGGLADNEFHLRDATVEQVKEREDALRRYYFGEDGKGGAVGALKDRQNFEEAAALEKKGKYYLDQIEEQKQLMKAVYNYELNKNYKATLEAYEVKYSKPNASIKDPELQAEDEILRKQRLQTIQKKLNEKR